MCDVIGLSESKAGNQKKERVRTLDLERGWRRDPVQMKDQEIHTATTPRPSKSEG